MAVKRLAGVDYLEGEGSHGSGYDFWECRRWEIPEVQSSLIRTYLMKRIGLGLVVVGLVVVLGCGMVSAQQKFRSDVQLL
jgi:hypothetical protein